MTGKPNLLFLWTDQQASHTISAYGNTTIETPNFDKLAERSIVFDQAYVTQTVCGVSRPSIMTGKYPHITGLTENNIPLPPDVECFPELGEFEEYETAFIGKWHLGDEIFSQHGFDQWIGIEDQYRAFYSAERDQTAHSDYYDYLIENGYEPDVTNEDGFQWFSRKFASNLPEEHSKPAFMARQARQFIHENRDKPFILHVMFLEPHSPHTSPRDDQYDPGEVPLPPNFEHDRFRC